MPSHKKDIELDTNIFREEIRKRVSVSDEELDKFLLLWEPMNFKRNEFILRAGEVPKFSMFVLDGCLRQFTTNDKGDETIIYFAEERHFLGDLSAMRNKVPSDFNFQAIEPCSLLVLKTDNWDKSFELFPWWAQAHMSGYQKWVTKMQQQMAAMHSQSGEEKYLNLLKERPSLFQRVPLVYIASYLGLSPETLSRIRKKITSV